MLLAGTLALRPFGVRLRASSCRMESRKEFDFDAITFAGANLRRTRRESSGEGGKGTIFAPLLRSRLELG